MAQRIPQAIGQQHRIELVHALRQMILQLLGVLAPNMPHHLALGALHLGNGSGRQIACDIGAKLADELGFVIVRGNDEFGSTDESGGDGGQTGAGTEFEDGAVGDGKGGGEEGVAHEHTGTPLTMRKDVMDRGRGHGDRDDGEGSIVVAARGGGAGAAGGGAAKEWFGSVGDTYAWLTERGWDIGSGCHRSSLSDGVSV